MAQHRWLNIDYHLKCPKPTKTPKIPNRQKSQKPPKIPDRQKFPTAKNFRATKKSRQKFPTNKKPHTKWNITKNSTIGLTRIILHCKSATLTTITNKT
jgi:hypothetical protein